MSFTYSACCGVLPSTRSNTLSYQQSVHLIKFLKIKMSSQYFAMSDVAKKCDVLVFTFPFEFIITCEKLKTFCKSYVTNFKLIFSYWTSIGRLLHLTYNVQWYVLLNKRSPFVFLCVTRSRGGKASAIMGGSGYPFGQIPVQGEEEH